MSNLAKWGISALIVLILFSVITYMMICHAIWLFIIIVSIAITCLLIALTIKIYQFLFENDTTN